MPAETRREAATRAREEAEEQLEISQRELDAAEEEEKEETAEQAEIDAAFGNQSAIGDGVTGAAAPAPEPAAEEEPEEPLPLRRVEGEQWLQNQCPAASSPRDHARRVQGGLRRHVHGRAAGALRPQDARGDRAVPFDGRRQTVDGDSGVLPFVRTPASAVGGGGGCDVRSTRVALLVS